MLDQCLWYLFLHRTIDHEKINSYKTLATIYNTVQNTNLEQECSMVIRLWPILLFRSDKHVLAMQNNNAYQITISQ